MKTKIKLMLAATVAVSGMTAGATADAAIVTYTDPLAFAAAITDATTNTFPFDAITDLPFNYTYGAVTFRQGNFLGFSGSYGGGGGGYIGSTGTTGITSTTSGVGFFLGGYSRASTITYSFGGTTGAFDVPSQPNTSFFGVVNTTGNLAGSLTTTYELDFVSFITGNAAPAVPEPATWAMLLIGFGMIGAASRYRRRNTAAILA